MAVSLRLTMLRQARRHCASPNIQISVAPQSPYEDIRTASLDIRLCQSSKGATFFQQSWLSAVFRRVSGKRRDGLVEPRMALLASSGRLWGRFLPAGREVLDRPCNRLVVVYTVCSMLFLPLKSQHHLYPAEAHAPSVCLRGAGDISGRRACETACLGPTGDGIPGRFRTREVEP